MTQIRKCNIKNSYDVEKWVDQKLFVLNHFAMVKRGNFGCAFNLTVLLVE
jgi:hypothetical protein